MALRFMTKENRPYLIKGDLLAGLQTYQEDPAPIFPLQNSPGTFSGTYTETFNVTARPGAGRPTVEFGHFTRVQQNRKLF